MCKSQSVVAAILLAVAGAAGAQEGANFSPEFGVAGARLTDSELDEIVAGRVLTVLIAPPNNNAPRLMQHDNGPTILIIPSGKGQDVFGSITMSNGDIKTIPGRN